MEEQEQRRGPTLLNFNTALGEVDHGRSSETRFKLARKFTLLSTVGSREKNVYTGFGLASVGAMC